MNNGWVRNLHGFEDKAIGNFHFKVVKLCQLLNSYLEWSTLESTGYFKTTSKSKLASHYKFLWISI